MQTSSYRFLFMTAFAVSLFFGTATASADVMPDCPEGQHLETNPVGPDDTHHTGGECVGELGSCAAAPGRRTPGVALWVVVAAGAVAVRRLRTPRR